MSTEGISTELYYQMALSLVPRVGPTMSKSLIGYCGSAEAVFLEKKSRLAKIPNIGTASAEAIFQFNNFGAVEKELEFISTNKIRAIHFTSPEYPVRLKQEMDSPLVLYVKGAADLNHHRFVAIVGTRRNTRAGSEITRHIVQGLQKYGAHTISGLAYGIDICAHKASMENHIPTIAVVAHGLDTIYPDLHAPQAQKMVENGGAIVSEHFSGTALNPDLFPRRNRIVAALCDCIVVVESMSRGGSMITAEIASGYNRDVFAVPGRPNDAMSAGCNLLIKSLKAALCESAEDVARNMNWELPENADDKPLAQMALFAELDGDEKKIVHLLGSAETLFDDILVQTQIPINKLSYMLLDLEMRGLLRSMPGKKYTLAT